MRIPLRAVIIGTCIVALLCVGVMALLRALHSETSDQTTVAHTTSPLTDKGDPATPTIYVSLVTHNEEPDGSAVHPDFTKDESEYWLQRDAVVDFARMLHERNIGYNWQSDWNFLLATTMFDHGTASTNGKNIVRYLSEDLDMRIGPHAHETTHTYADVAALIDELGVTPSGVVGGFLVRPPARSKLEYLRNPIRGNIYDFTWTPEILWGGGSPFHVDDPEVSGVWLPKNTKNYFTHDDTGTLPNVGTYRSTWEGVEELLALQAAGALPAGKIYTASVMITQDMIAHDDARVTVASYLDAMADEIDDGRLVFADIESVIAIWEARYDRVPNIYRATP